MTTDVAKKISLLRRLLGESQSEFADRFGVEQPTVSRWEKGMPVARKYQKAIAATAGVSLAEFFHSGEQPRIVPVVGFVAAGEKFTPFDDFEQGDGVDQVQLTLGDGDVLAVSVRGDSMSPVYRDGDVIVAKRIGRREVDKAIGRDAIVRTRTGEGYVKRIMPGSKRGLYRLRSYNASYDDIEDVELDWAAPVEWIKRRT